MAKGVRDGNGVGASLECDYEGMSHLEDIQSLVFEAIFTHSA